MAVTQIVGPRIAPYWADPVEWTSTRAYEPFTFVTYQGDSYCSRQDTPIGIDITNDDYWVKVSDYNAQAVALQREMTNTIEAAESSMESTIQTAENTMTSTINAADASINQKIADANANMASQVAAVESVKNEFQSSLDQVATNTKNIATNASNITINTNSIDTNRGDILIVGDSWAEPYEVKSWPTFSHYLGNYTNAKIHNYALGGSSLTSARESNVINTQYQRAKADTSYDHGTIRNIIVCGGVNDYRVGINYNAVVTALHTIINEYSQEFPNARFIIVLSHQALITDEQVRYNFRIVNGMADTAALTLDTCGWLPFPNGYQTDYLHPSNNTTNISGSSSSSIGTMIMTKNVLAALYGGDMYHAHHIFVAMLRDGQDTNAGFNAYLNMTYDGHGIFSGGSALQIVNQNVPSNGSITGDFTITREGVFSSETYPSALPGCIMQCAFATNQLSDISSTRFLYAMWKTNYFVEASQTQFKCNIAAYNTYNTSLPFSTQIIPFVGYVAN